MKIKICGITNIDDALFCAEKGVDALGFIFYEKSRRCVEPEKAAEIISLLPPFVDAVGVFVNESPNRVLDIEASCNLDYLQFHGDETTAFLQSFNKSKVIKVIRVSDEQSIEAMSGYDCSSYLLDTYSDNVHGGTGKTFDWNLAKKAKQYGKIILSGGLGPDNVADAIKRVAPYAVDAASLLEASPGKKDKNAVAMFINEAKKAFLNQS